MRAAATFVLAACLTAAACGGSGASSRGGGQPAAGTLEALYRASGQDVAIVPGTSDYAPGRVRVSFLVVDARGRAILRPTARVWLARGLDAKPFEHAIARQEALSAAGASEGDVQAIYVTQLLVPSPGKYWLLAEPVGGRRIQAIGNLQVAATSDVPAVGGRAPASRTPTLASTHGDVAALTTRTPPDRDLLRYSVADSLLAKVPFVVTFATPRFCSSRTCGPVVDVVESVARRFRSSRLRFIHVEIYEDNDPSKGTNRWVKQWRLPTEPWTFLVGADGRIKAELEGAFSAGELTGLLRTKLRVR